MARVGVEYGQVAERWDKALIVASGPSAGEVNWSTLKLPKDIAVIAVKSAVRYVPQATHWITIDGNEKSRKLIQHRREGVNYYAAMPPHYTGPKDGVIFLKRITGIHTRGGEFGLAENPAELHAGNSGYAALGLAYHFHGKKIAMLGVDGTGGYWFDEHAPRSLKHLPELFESAKEQLDRRGIELLNGSPKSNVVSWPRVNADEAIDWLVRVNITGEA